MTFVLITKREKENYKILALLILIKEKLYITFFFSYILGDSQKKRKKKKEKKRLHSRNVKHLRLVIAPFYRVFMNFSPLDCHL